MTATGDWQLATDWSDSEGQRARGPSEDGARLLSEAPSDDEPGSAALLKTRFFPVIALSPDTINDYDDDDYSGDPRPPACARKRCLVSLFSYAA